MDVPPSRYKVVEKGRRLIVVDRLTGDVVRKHEHDFAPSRGEMPRSAPPQSAARPPRAAAGMSSGGARFTTDTWYDSKAPRDIQLTDNAQVGLIAGTVAAGIIALIVFVNFGVFALIVGAVVLANARKGFRPTVTLWLDRYARD